MLAYMLIFTLMVLSSVQSLFACYFARLSMSKVDELLVLFKKELIGVNDDED